MNTRTRTIAVVLLVIGLDGAHARDPGDPAGETADDSLRAQSVWALCKTGPWPLHEGRRGLELDIDRSGALVDMAAREVQLAREKQAVLIGDVEAGYADIAVRADRVTWDERTRVLEASGDVRYEDKLIAMRSQHAEVNLAEETARIDGGEYQLRALRGHGSAESMEIRGRTLARLANVSYSTCDPGQPDWVLRASELELDFAEGVGRARKATIRFKDVPVFYIPYGTFPIDDRRKSGFLAPVLGTTSDNGPDFALPYYWNIAPNMDATIRPRYISDRGWLLGAEFRYLAERHAGEVWGEFLSNDEQTDEDRWLARYHHASKLGSTWSARVNYRRVSDDNYFEDFGDSLFASATPFLQSQASVEGYGHWWHFLAQLEDFQVLDEIRPENEPYKRLPRFVLNGSWPMLPLLQFDFAGELVNFDRDFGVTGTRLDLYPSLSLPWVRPGYYVRPKVGFRYTDYELDDTPGDTSPDRTLSVFSLDTALFFDRRSNGRRTQTLQPRLYYLYVDFENQDDLPVFDTIEMDFTRSQLFLENRFSGPDRINDANQATLALTSRHYNTRRGRELFNLTLGQIYYFRDREVTLPEEAPQTTSESPLVADLNVMPGSDWYLGGTVHWNPDRNQIDLGAAQLRWQPGSDRLLNFSYRFREDLIEQVDLSGVAPLSRNWSLLGRWNYSIRDERTLEVFAGLQYDSCCWAFRIVGRRYVRNREGDSRNSIFLELNLRGLAAFGRPAASFLERGILGYRPDF